MGLFYQDYHKFQFIRRVLNLDFAPHLHDAVETFFFTQGSSRSKSPTDITTKIPICNHRGAFTHAACRHCEYLW